ncbi:THAP domain-containing protein 1 B-like [Ornithodoros turicata]|uniref:THAP domain-containing protein 1 B-like n=1 Tax=Ornithodoros turicata TaxID=34597 RepID=UPI003139C889
MPKNCCVPICTSCARKDPHVKYQEFPCKPDVREAWLKMISREGAVRGSKWQPCDRSLVCSLHFTEADYKKGVKRKLLLPTAVPSLFEGYPSYMQDCHPTTKRRRRSSTSRNAQKQATLTGIPCAPAEADAVMPEDEEHICEDETLHPEQQPDHEERETHFPLTFADQECQTTLDIRSMKEEHKRNMHRLNMKVRRLNESLGSLQQQLDEACTQLQNLQKQQPMATRRPHFKGTKY